VISRFINNDDGTSGKRFYTSLVIRIVLGIIGLLALVRAAWGKGHFRWGLYEFEDDSDIVLDRRTGRLVAAVIGIAFILGAILYKGQE
jgi:hypothetical protein